MYPDHKADKNEIRTTLIKCVEHHSSGQKDIHLISAGLFPLKSSLEFSYIVFSDCNSYIAHIYRNYQNAATNNFAQSSHSSKVKVFLSLHRIRFYLLTTIG